MTITAVLRGLVLVLALMGVLDASFTIHRLTPVAVDIRTTAFTIHRLTPDEAGVRQRLERALGDRVAFNSAGEAAALVLVGNHPTARVLPDANIPVSTVGTALPSSSAVRIVSATSPAPVPVGWTATFEATIEATGRRGTTSRIVLTQGDAELAHVEHAWTSDRERFDARLSYAPPVEGSARVTLRVGDKPCSEPCPAASVDLRAVALGRRLKILAHEPRPSWATAFVRRALEDDAVFDVASLVRSSRSLNVRSGSPPPALTADALNTFDVVLVGAPEELRAAEVDALRSFARRRGGTIVLLPDRRPSGPYLQLIPAGNFDEILVETPIDLKTESGATFRASELAIPRDGVRAMETLASTATEKDARAVIVAWPAGIGTIVFSGALDAWRYRATAGESFARFWRARVAEAALMAPPRLQVSLSPEIARPGEAVTIHARLRPTELVEAPSTEPTSGAGRTNVPAVRATAVGQNTQENVRLWPTAEAGLFEGHLRAPEAGTIDVHVTADNGAVGDDILTVAADATHPDGNGQGSRELVAASTGGVAVTAADLGPLEQHLRSLPSARVAESWHPTRSPWFVMMFVAVACSEWALRRRRGQF